MKRVIMNLLILVMIFITATSAIAGTPTKLNTENITYQTLVVRQGYIDLEDTIRNSEQYKGKDLEDYKYILKRELKTYALHTYEKHVSIVLGIYKERGNGLFSEHTVIKDTVYKETKYTPGIEQYKNKVSIIEEVMRYFELESDGIYIYSANDVLFNPDIVTIQHYMKLGPIVILGIILIIVITI